MFLDHERFLGVVNDNVIEMNLPNLVEDKHGGEDIFYEEFFKAVEAVVYEIFSIKSVDLCKVDPEILDSIVESSYGKVKEKVAFALSDKVKSLIR